MLPSEFSTVIGHSSVMAEKHLINSVENCVRECLYGFSKLNPNLSIDFTKGIVIDDNCWDNNKRIGVISGGGSGHEPFPSGYVGNGMLSASVSGPIFTCPPSNHILQAIRSVASKSAGVLLLVPNYTGDVLNFGLAAENAMGEGLKVESVIVGDDVAQEVSGSQSKAGRRGMCGLVLLIKIMGHLSGGGEDLGTLKRWALGLVESMGSMGLCVRACSKPGVGPLFQLEEDEVEVGVGVHGEAGIHRRKMLSAAEAVKTLLDYILRSLRVDGGDEVVVLVNNLGSLSIIEELVLAGEVESQLMQRKISICRLYSGRFFTSINMSGVQICILKLKNDNRDIVLTALDYQTTASAWPKIPDHTFASHNITIQQPHRFDCDFEGPRLSFHHLRLFADSLMNVSRALKAEENRLNILDSVCGDGDCGSTFHQIGSLIESSADSWDFSHPKILFSRLCSMMEDSVGGTTGALYGLFFRGISQELGRHNDVNAIICAKCWRSGVDLIKKYSSARLGDRTMLDSLESGCYTFEKHLQEEPINPERGFKKAVEEAKTGCQKTKTMRAQAGRASYTEQSNQNDVDAGAYAVTVWLSAIEKVLDEHQTK